MNDSFGRRVFGREGHGVILIYSCKCFLDGLKYELCIHGRTTLVEDFCIYIHERYWSEVLLFCVFLGFYIIK